MKLIEVLTDASSADSIRAIAEKHESHYLSLTTGLPSVLVGVIYVRGGLFWTA